MVKHNIEGKEFEIGTISYGDFMDIQDKFTVIDEFTGQGRLLNGKATRELILNMVKDSEGKPVDVSNAKQCSFAQGRALDIEVTKLIKTQNVKNPSEGQKQDSQSLPIGKE